MYNLKILIPLTMVLFLIGSVSAICQPSPNQLADQMFEINQQRLSNIQNLAITMKMDLAGFENETTTHYVKTESDGSAILVLDDGSDEPDSELFEGVYDGSVEEIIRSGESVSNDRLAGKNVFKVIINDRELLNRLSENEFDGHDADFEIERAILWIDPNELLPLKMTYDQFADGSGVTVEITMEDYRSYSGLPVAHHMTMTMEGIDNMFSDEEIAEARDAMRQLEEQLASMSSAQREMIESQMSGQIERFEKMIESGSGGSTLMEVLDVRVNQ